jgi:uncharacterized protein (TIGR00297 family)
MAGAGVMSAPWEIALGFAAGLVLAWLGRRGRELTLQAQALLVIGILAIYATQGWMWGALATAGLLTSGLAIRYRREFKRALPGSRAPWQRPLTWQALVARLGWPVLLALLSVTSRNDYYLAFVGSLAAMNADVWATELGILSVDRPRLLINRRSVIPGTSGGVSLLGTMAAVGGAWLVGFVALLLITLQAQLSAVEESVDRGMLWLPIASLTGGIVGVVTDSLLGSTAQAIYYCEECDAYCEEPLHDCGHSAQHVRGWPWMTNEAIDLMSVLVGAGVTVAAANVLSSF